MDNMAMPMAMASDMAMASSIPRSPCYSKNLKDITMIKGLSTEEALTIVENDNWFDTAKTDSNTQRYILYTTEKNNATNIDNITKFNDPSCRVDKNIDRKNIKADWDAGLITGEKLAAVLFSINGNIEPFKHMKKFVENGGNIDYSDEKMNLKKMFLAHISWFHSAGGIKGYGVESDPLIREELERMNPLQVPETSLGNNIFNSELFTIFGRIVNDLSINNGKLKENLDMDLDRANNYLKVLKPSPSPEPTSGYGLFYNNSGGNRKLNNKKSKKTKKNKKNGNRKSRKH